MENIGKGELRSNPIADQCLKCFALYIKSTRNGPAQARVMMKSVLSSAEHGRCPHKYQNWEQLLAFQYLRVG